MKLTEKTTAVGICSGRNLDGGENPPPCSHDKIHRFTDLVAHRRGHRQRLGFRIEAEREGMGAGGAGCWVFCSRSTTRIGYLALQW